MDTLIIHLMKLEKIVNELFLSELIICGSLTSNMMLNLRQLQRFDLKTIDQSFPVNEV